MQLQEIALGERQCGAYISNVDHFCASEGKITDSGRSKIEPFVVLAGTGFLFQVLSLSLISACIGLQVSTYISQKASDYTFEGYGMFWGISTGTFLLTTVICSNGVILIGTTFMRHGATLAFPYFMLIILTFILVTSILVVVYIFRKNTPRPKVPRMYSFAFQLLTCGCYGKKWAETAVVGVAWWFILVALQGLLCHGVYILLAALASPTTVPFNVMALVLLFACIIYTSALLYTISAYICTSPKKRQKGSGTAVVRAAILVPLLVTMMCYTSLIVACGDVVNSDTKQNSYLSLIASAIGTVIIGLLTFGLKWFIAAWVKWSPNNTGYMQHSDGNEDGEDDYHIISDV